MLVLAACCLRAPGSRARQETGGLPAPCWLAAASPGGISHVSSDAAASATAARSTAARAATCAMPSQNAARRMRGSRDAALAAPPQLLSAVVPARRSCPLPLRRGCVAAPMTITPAAARPPHGSSEPCCCSGCRCSSCGCSSSCCRYCSVLRAAVTVERPEMHFTKEGRPNGGILCWWGTLTTLTRHESHHAHRRRLCGCARARVVATCNWIRPKDAVVRGTGAAPRNSPRERHHP